MGGAGPWCGWLQSPALTIAGTLVGRAAPLQGWELLWWGRFPLGVEGGSVLGRGHSSWLRLSMGCGKVGVTLEWVNWAGQIHRGTPG